MQGVPSFFIQLKKIMNVQKTQKQKNSKKQKANNVFPLWSFVFEKQKLDVIADSYLQRDHKEL